MGLPTYIIYKAEIYRIIIMIPFYVHIARDISVSIGVGESAGVPE